MKILRILFFIAFYTLNIYAQLDFDIEVLNHSTYTSFDKIHPGSEFKFAVKLNIDKEWHINSNKPNDEYLIGTEFNVQLPEGFELVTLQYPEAHNYSFSFSEKPVSVYEGEVFISGIIKAPASFKLGLIEIPISIIYQACNNQSCLAPNEISDTLSFEVVSIKESVAEINSEIFNKLKISYNDVNESDDKDSIAGTLENSGLLVSILFVFLGGLALNLTPCVYPLIPITIGFFAGQSEGRTGQLTILGIFYVLGMALTYSIVGVITSLSGAVFGTLLQNTWVIIAVALVLIALSLSMFGVYEFKMPDKLVMMAGGAKSGVYGAFFMGLTMGIVAAPCIGPFVLGLVTYVGAKGDPVYGFFMFFFLAVGLGFPYLILAIFSGKIKSLPRAGVWMESIKQIFGYIMIGMAIYFLNPILPEPLNEYLLPVFMILSVILLFIFDRHSKELKVFHAVKIVLSLLVLVVAVYWLIPKEKKSPEWVKFTMEDYQTSVESGNKILIDFYADWCLPCKELDALTFSDERVIELLKDYKTFKVDMTSSSDEKNEIIRKKFSIIGMPTIIFIDNSGNEVKRLTGFVDADEFLGILKEIN